MRLSTSRPSRCCVEMRMRSISTGRWIPCSSTSYRTVTCDFPSGRRYGSTSALRTSASRFVSLCASRIGSGMSSSVSPVA